MGGRQYYIRIDAFSRLMIPLTMLCELGLHWALSIILAGLRRTREAQDTTDMCDTAPVFETEVTTW